MTLLQKLLQVTSHSCTRPRVVSRGLYKHLKTYGCNWKLCSWSRSDPEVTCKIVLKPAEASGGCLGPGAMQNQPLEVGHDLEAASFGSDFEPNRGKDGWVWPTCDPLQYWATQVGCDLQFEHCLKVFVGGIFCYKTEKQIPFGIKLLKYLTAQSRSAWPCRKLPGGRGCLSPFLE